MEKKVLDNGKMVYGNSKKYDWIGKFVNGFARVKLNNKWGFIDTTDKEITECKYDYVDYFINGLVRVQLNGKYGLIDTTGKEVIKLKYKTSSGAKKGLEKYLG